MDLSSSRTFLGFIFLSTGLVAALAGSAVMLVLCAVITLRLPTRKPDALPSPAAV
jgi:hypothetical protein